MVWIDNEQEYMVVVNIDSFRKMSHPYFIKCEEILSEIDEGISRLSELEVDMRIVSPDIINVANGARIWMYDHWWMMLPKGLHALAQFLK